MTREQFLVDVWPDLQRRAAAVARRQGDDEIESLAACHAWRLYLQGTIRLARVLIRRAIQAAIQGRQLPGTTEARGSEHRSVARSRMARLGDVDVAARGPSPARVAELHEEVAQLRARLGPREAPRIDALLAGESLPDADLDRIREQLGVEAQTPRQARQREARRLRARGHSLAQIARQLGVSQPTVVADLAGHIDTAGMGRVERARAQRAAARMAVV